MRRISVLIIAAGFICSTYCAVPHLRVAPAAAEGGPSQKPEGELGKETGTAQQPLSASRAAREEKALQDARRQQLTEREAEFAVKEQELKKLSAKLDAQLKSLEESKKRLDETLNQKKKVGDEKRKKMLVLLKKMRPEQAGQFLGKMEEVAVISILNELDNKMILKLMPFLNQPMVLRWINNNLKNS